MSVRNRIKKMTTILGSELKKHPKNWRTHGDSQKLAMRGILDDVGIATAVVARELPDGTLELIDGHLRADMLDHEEIPVIVLDVNEDEANRLLLAMDPIGAMAGVDKESLISLLNDVQFSNENLSGLIESLTKKTGLLDGDEKSLESFETTYQVVVDCSGEEEQRKVYDTLTERGHSCRVLTL